MPNKLCVKLFIISQTSAVAPLKIGNGDMQFHPTLFIEYNYLSMLRLELNHFSKRGPSSQFAQLYSHVKNRDLIELWNDIWFQKDHCVISYRLFIPNETKITKSPNSYV